MLQELKHPSALSITSVRACNPSAELLIVRLRSFESLLPAHSKLRAARGADSQDSFLVVLVGCMRVKPLVYRWRRRLFEDLIPNVSGQM